MNRRDKAIARGVAYLDSAQTADGFFVTYAGGDRSLNNPHELPTIFGSALMLTSLAGVEPARSIRNKLAQWLLSQKNSDWSFNYWMQHTHMRQLRPYPNDLDDTFCALIALYLHDPKLIDSVCLAKVVRLLLATESEVGGPYKTWLASKTAPDIWQDKDVAVNANIAYFLRLVAEPLPKLHALLERAILAKDFSSPYYPASWLVIYFVARAYQGEAKGVLVDHILNKRVAGCWGTPARTALALSALHSLGGPSASAAVSYLLNQQQADGSWPAEGLWLDERRPGHRSIYAGSAALTTAFVLEALSASRQARSGKTAGQGSGQADVHAVYSQAQRQLQPLGEPLWQQSVAKLRDLAQGVSAREIMLLPRLFAASLTQAPNMPQSFYTELSLANTFGWMAYTIYDDFLDDEGETGALCIANVALRRSLDSFRRALPRVDFEQRVRQAFDRIDVANAWEVAHCRFVTDDHTFYITKLPRYKSVVFLAERSIGHSLTALAVLIAGGIDINDPRMELFEKGFRHYLAARQLNDDLHDWQQDFAHGQLSYVVTYLLRAIDCKIAVRQSMTQTNPRLQQQFWRVSLPHLCGTVTRQVQLSRQAFARTGFFKRDAPFMQLLDKLDDSMARTLEEQQKAKGFLQAYGQK